MMANERIQQQTSDSFGFSALSSLPFASYLRADIMKKGSKLDNSKLTGEFKPCKSCGTIIYSMPNQNKEFCSNKCKYIGRKKYKICKLCGKSFFKKSAKYYCSISCSNKANWKNKRNMVKCRVCRKEFNVPPRIVKMGKGKYCSRDCYNLKRAGLTTKKVNLIKQHMYLPVKELCERFSISNTTLYRHFGEELKNVKNRLTYCLDCNKEIKYKLAKPLRCKICSNVQKKKMLLKNGRIHNRKRRAIKHYIREVFTNDEWINKLDKTKGVCSGYKREPHFVGKDKLSLDHIYPISKAENGRIYTIDDVQPLCRSCNARKSDEVIEYAY